MVVFLVSEYCAMSQLLWPGRPTTAVNLRPYPEYFNIANGRTPRSWLLSICLISHLSATAPKNTLPFGLISNE